MHVMEGGRIITTGGKELALELESRGYEGVIEQARTEVGARWYSSFSSLILTDEISLTSALVVEMRIWLSCEAVASAEYTVN